MKNSVRNRVIAAAAIAALAFAGAFDIPREYAKRGAAWAQAQMLEGTVFAGRWYSGGAKPTTVTCTIADGATNMFGRVTAVGVTTCTITFVANGGAAAAWTGGAPVCMVNDETATRAAMTTAVTTTTLVVAAVTSGDIFTYACFGRT